MRRIHFIGFQGAVCGAVGEAVSDGFTICSDLLSGWICEEVETLVGDKKGFIGFLENCLDLSVWGGDGKFHRSIAG